MGVKTIEVPAKLFIEVSDAMTEEDIRQLKRDLESECLGTVQQGVMEPALQEHLSAFNTDPKRVLSAQLWVFESSKTITFTEVGDSYDAEGKGPYEVIGRFWDDKEAEKFAKGRGNYGKDAHCRTKTLIIAETCEDMEQYKVEEVRQRALNKLSAEEKAALGVS